MKIELNHQIDAPLETVMMLLANVDFACARAKASGAQDADAVLDTRDDGGFTISIRRTMPAESIPAEMRSLVGGSLDVKYTEAWEQAEAATERRGTFALEILGAPGRVAGDMVVTAAGASSRIDVTGEVRAPVPLFGPMIEKAIADAVAAGLEKEFAIADEWAAQAS